VVRTQIFCRDAITLEEFDCHSNTIYSKLYDCSKGCEDGACIYVEDMIEKECIDSDGGFDYYTKGTAEGYAELGRIYSF